MRAALFVIVLALVGCQTANKTIGGTALGIETAAERIVAECGNAAPGGDCREGSLLSLDEKRSLKKTLLMAVDALEAANRAAKIPGGERDVAANLKRAESLLESVEVFLREKEIR